MNSSDIISTVALPLEVWGMIGTEADPNDLANLRLASKDMNAVATRPFGLSRLAHRRFIVSPYSLQGLVELTAHPVLGPCVESISLGTYRMNEDYAGFPVILYDSDTKNAAFEAAVVQCDFDKRGGASNALIKALTNLKHRNIRVGLGIHDDLVDDHNPRSDDLTPHDPEWTPTVRRIVRRAYGFVRLYGQLNLSHVGCREVERSLVNLCFATRQTAYDLNALCLDLDKSRYKDTGRASGASLHTLVKALVFPYDSTTPALDLTITFCVNSTGIYASRRDSFLTLQSDRSLEIINHGIHTQQEPAPTLYDLTYGLFTVALYQNRCDKIVLQNCQVDLILPHMWLRYRSNTLRRLELLNLFLYGHDSDDEGGILDVWKALQANFSLEVLVLDGYTFDNSVRGAEFSGRVTLRGAEIRVGLRKLIEKTAAWMRDSSERDGEFDMPRMVGYRS
jgi:hypothetical protein